MTTTKRRRKCPQHGLHRAAIVRSWREGYCLRASDAITREEAERICEWDGWHWIILAQLRMFLGLSEVEVPPEPWRVEAVTAKGTT